MHVFVAMCLYGIFVLGLGAAWEFGPLPVGFDDLVWVERCCRDRHLPWPEYEHL